MNKFIAYSVIQEPVEFTLDDCPHFTADGIVTLLSREDSPLIDARTIMRDFSTFAEGDVVEYEGETGIVLYDTGLLLKTENGIKKINKENHILLKDRRFETAIEVSKQKRTSILFIYKNTLYGFNDFIFHTGSYLCVVGSRGKVPVKDLLPFTGITYDGKPLGFGSSFKGGVIVLHNGEPHIRYKDEYILLKEDLK